MREKMLNGCEYCLILLFVPLWKRFSNTNFIFFISVLVKPPYEVTETGWGEFEVVIKIYFNDPNERPVKYFFLDLLCSLCYNNWLMFLLKMTSRLTGLTEYSPGSPCVNRWKTNMAWNTMCILFFLKEF